ncbi:DUF2779 domain-containing protein [Coraliomargarita parva]|uniref:DUF2779 domain-containing protein n=1 Tax=Coraliomargarita parva TaxID=3014050 RepID=UPI0022B2CAEA|nr:DUF2779 domain-containing protein [Coraliomargarita parva]
MRQLSKSKLIAYRQCPKRLWLEIHKPELRDDSGSEASFAIGNEVGDVARVLYDPDQTGENVDPNRIGWDAAYERTAALLQSGEAPIFEAALRMPGALALADVMLPDRSLAELHWRMIEVKSSTGVKDYHLDDASIQTYVAEQSGIRLSQVGIAHINNQFVYQGDGDYKGLLAIEDITQYAKGRSAEVAGWIEQAQAVAAEANEPLRLPGPHCHTPFACGFCEYCWKDMTVPTHSPNLLPRLRSEKFEDWIGRGIFELHEVPNDEINAIQQRVKSCTLRNETYFDAATAGKRCQFDLYPVYFLDFETVNFAVPRWKGTRPYQQLPFQYSLHKCVTAGSIAHREFLDTSGQDPREVLARQLIEDCGDRGPIYAYNVGFEKRVLRELAEAYPAHATKLEAISERMKDLLPIARDCYYHPSQEGSWSLKAVLPAICPDLSYASLKEVQHGGAAVEAYLEAISPETSSERKAELRERLLEYCKLDTLATVRIWEFFRGNTK